MTRTIPPRDTPYLRAYNGRLKGVMRWHQLDALWDTLRRRADDGWYVYTVGEAPPVTPATRDEFERFLSDIRKRLGEEHEEDYCGIVYADDHDEPGFLRIYRPDNLGVVCGYSESPPLPGWTLSRMPPDDLERAFPRPDNRRWWQKIFR